MVSDLNSKPQSSTPRRILAVILPELLCEMARTKVLAQRVVASSKNLESQGKAKTSAFIGSRAKEQNQKKLVIGVEPPLGVVLLAHATGVADDKQNAVLTAVNAVAAQYGVRVGQRVSEAQAFLAQIKVCTLSVHQVEEELGKVAEVMLRFGVTVAYAAPDTLWLDTTGVAHLFGGEARLAEELGIAVRQLGHMVRIAIANGPVVSQALARHAAACQYKPLFVSNDKTKESLEDLPIVALPIKRELTHANPVSEEIVAWLMRCGIRTVGELWVLPSAALASRLGEHASAVADFIQGRDSSPLVAYTPPSAPAEEMEFEDGVELTEPLLFVARGLVARLAVRLEARGQAAGRVNLILNLKSGGVVEERFELPVPIYKAEEILRIVSTRLARLVLIAPVLKMRIETSQLSEAVQLQLELSRIMTGSLGGHNKAAEVLPALVAELVGDIGSSHVGMLKVASSHRPERKSVMTPWFNSKASGTRVSAKAGQFGVGTGGATVAHARVEASLSFAELLKERTLPTRVLDKAVPFPAKLELGETVLLGCQLFTVKQLRFEQRLEHVEWWSGSGIARDYWRVWLSSPSGGVDALVFVDRKTGQRYLQAIYD